MWRVMERLNEEPAVPVGRFTRQEIRALYLYSQVCLSTNSGPSAFLSSPRNKRIAEQRATIITK